MKYTIDAARINDNSKGILMEGMIITTAPS
jgi:hypothetical protein